MARLKIVELYSYTDWCKGVFRNAQGNYINIVFARHFSTRKGESHELICAECGGMALYPSHPEWKEIDGFLASQTVFTPAKAA